MSLSYLLRVAFSKVIEILGVMDLSFTLQMASSLGQITQVRIIFPKSTFDSLNDFGEIQLIDQDDFQVAVLLNLEVNLFAKIAEFTEFIEKDEKNLLIKEIEVDLDSMDSQDEFTVLLNPDNDIILLHTTATDKIRAKSQIQIEWIKHIAQIKK